MGRREQLEKELAEAQEQIDNAPADIPQDMLAEMHRECNDISFELNNLYDDYETRAE